MKLAKCQLWMSTEDAVAIHIAVNAKRSIGMHWGKRFFFSTINWFYISWATSEVCKNFLWILSIKGVVARMNPCKLLSDGQLLYLPHHVLWHMSIPISNENLAFSLARYIQVDRWGDSWASLAGGEGTVISESLMVLCFYWSYRISLMLEHYSCIY